MKVETEELGKRRCQTEISQEIGENQIEATIQDMMGKRTVIMDMMGKRTVTDMEAGRKQGVAGDQIAGTVEVDLTAEIARTGQTAEIGDKKKTLVAEDMIKENRDKEKTNQEMGTKTTQGTVEEKKDQVEVKRTTRKRSYANTLWRTDVNLGKTVGSVMMKDSSRKKLKE